MDIREHGLFIVDSIQIEPLPNAAGARVIAHGRRYPITKDLEETVRTSSYQVEVECKSRIEVQSTVVELLSHSYWGVE